MVQLMAWCREIKTIIWTFVDYDLRRHEALLGPSALKFSQQRGDLSCSVSIFSYNLQIRSFIPINHVIYFCIQSSAVRTLRSTASCSTMCYHTLEAEYSLIQWYKDGSCLRFQRKWFNTYQATLNNEVHYRLYVANIFVYTTKQILRSRNHSITLKSIF